MRITWDYHTKYKISLFLPKQKEEQNKQIEVLHKQLIKSEKSVMVLSLTEAKMESENRNKEI